MLAVIVSVIVIIVLYLDYKLKPKHGNILPYRVPVLGHTHVLFSRDMHKTLEYWAKLNNGAPFTFQILHKHLVVLNDYDSIQEALVTKGKETGGRIQLFRTNYVLPESLGFLNTSPEWQKYRKLIHSLLRMYGERLTYMEELASSATQDMVDVVKDEIAKQGGQLAILDPKDAAENVITSIMLQLLIGKKSDVNDPLMEQFRQIRHLTQTYLVSFDKGMELDLFPWLRHTFLLKVLENSLN